MGVRWVDPSGVRSSEYMTLSDARQNAIYNARVRAGVPGNRAGRRLDADLEEILWKSMLSVGWKIEMDP